MSTLTLVLSILLSTFITGYHSFGDDDHDDVHDTCTNRFEYRHELKKIFNNCTKLVKLNPTCGKNITIAYSEHPPYVFADHHDGKIVGILPAMIQFTLDSCCFGCNHVNYIGPFSQMEKFYRQATFALPIQTSSSTSKYFGHDFIHMFDIKAVNFIGAEPKQESGTKIRIIFSAVFSTWPLFTTALFMAVTAGVAIWVLDSSLNVQEFPNTFPRGPFEGFWWAVVSMTTVGYGDRSPRSFCARLFAMLWILIGITIFSMYSATLTSALTTAVIKSHEIPLYKKNFAVLNSTTIGKITAMKQSSSYTDFESYSDIKTAIHRDTVDGMALDENIANYYSEHDESDVHVELQLYERVLVTGSSYGMVSYDEDFTKLFKSFFESNDDQKDSMALLGMGEHMYDNLLEKVQPTSANIYGSRKMLSYTLGSLSVLTAILASMGIYLKRRKRRKLKELMVLMKWNQISSKVENAQKKKNDNQQNGASVDNVSTIRLKKESCCRNLLFLDDEDFENNKCITATDLFKTVCLNKHVLKTALATWNDFHQDNKNLKNKNFRFIAYKQYVSWINGYLGKKRRRPLPYCVITAIRQIYPDPRGIYIPYSECK